MPNESSGNIVISPSILVTIIGAALAAGAGGYGAISPQIAEEAIKACYDNSQAALDVGVQHGQEMLEIRRLITEKTMYRYTTGDAEKHRIIQGRRDDSQDRSIRTIERDIDSLKARQK